ncbi:cysteine desulfurase [Catalinimonas alkaloidigena]|uniref:cysteine desulfurase n=1 Tax=Catalinimonas alkaloidigena TaxID=1075417 RepID=A0A1G9DZJ1_9BACT|nr:cysteine desulfurase family protein [Catalinimonas alkaloidigena]SDK69240.1 cysteine desulfurase [Catalinimonas alkaloidigena]
MRVYLDNAATTPLDPVVLEAMLPYWQQHFGNPSSIHSFGREVRAAVEKARRKVADLLHARPSEIFFTSCGTEADNTALRGSVHALGIQHIITSPLEHHAVLHTVQHLASHGSVALHFVELDAQGHIDLSHLEALLKQHPHALVSLMQGNNEIGNLTDLQAVGTLCRQYDAVYHSDTVQTVGHFQHNLQATPVDFIVGSAHKFHGPKGVGFLYVNSDRKISPLLFGGAQERNMRGGTENVAGIVGLATALELACTRLEEDRRHITALKQRLMTGLREKLDGAQFVGDCANLERSLYTVLNVSLPPDQMGDMFLFNLDINQIAASGGSACSSGSNVGSHVLQALRYNEERHTVRFSFSKYNTAEEVDFVIDTLVRMRESSDAMQL